MATHFIRGSKGSNSLSEFTVQALDFSDEILKQGRKQLKGMETAANAKARAAINHLILKKEDASYQADARREALAMEQRWRELANANVQHNFNVEQKNLKTRHETSSRKLQAMFNIMGATVKTGLAVQELEKRRKEKALKKLDSGPNRLLDSKQAVAASEAVDKLIENQHLDKVALSTKLKDGGILSDHQIKSLVGFSTKELKDFKKYSAIILGKNLGNFIDTTGHTIKVNYNGLPTSLEQAVQRYGQDGNISHLNNVSNQVYDYLKETYGQNISDEDWDENIRPAYNTYLDEKIRSKGPVLDRKAKNEQDAYDAAGVLEMWNGIRKNNGGNAENPLADIPNNASNFLYKLLVESKPKNIDSKRWEIRQTNHLKNLIRQGLIPAEIIDYAYASKVAFTKTEDGKTTVVNDPADLKGVKFGTWGNRRPELFQELFEFRNKLDEENDQKLKVQQGILERKQKQSVIDYKTRLSLLNEQGFDLLNDDSYHLREMGIAMQSGNTKLAKFIAGNYLGIEGNASDMNLEMARQSINYYRNKGNLDNLKVINLTKHLPHADRVKIRNEVKTYITAGDGTVLQNALTGYRTNLSNVLKGKIGFISPISGASLFESPSYKAKEKKVLDRFDQLRINFTPTAAIEVNAEIRESGETIDADTKQVRIMQKAAKMSFEALNKEVNDPNNKEYEVEMSSDGLRKQFKYSLVGSGGTSTEGEKIYSNDLLNIMAAELKLIPDAFSYPRLPDIISPYELKHAINTINEGGMFQPTEAMKAISDRFYIDGKKGNYVGLLTKALEKHQKSGDQMKITLLEDEPGKGLQHPLFRFLEVVNHASTVNLQNVVGPGIPADPDATEVFTYWVNQGVTPLNPEDATKEGEVQVTPGFHFSLQNPLIPSYLRSTDALLKLKELIKTREKLKLPPLTSLQLDYDRMEVTP